MGFNKKDQMILSRMQEAKHRHEDLREVFNFYEKLFQAQFAFKSQLEAGPTGRSLQGKTIQLSSMADGIPQITFDDLNMAAASFMEPYQSILELLTQYTGDSPSLGERPQPDRILRYAREIFDRRGPFVGPEPPLDYPRTASGWVLAPFLQLACESIMPRLDLNQWDYGYCPLCGGTPSLAALNIESGARTLLCSRCNGEWSFRRIGCPSCRGNDPQTYYPSEDGQYRLYACSICNHYLKTVIVHGAGSDVCLPVECIVAVPMDIAAQGKGYTF